MRFNCCMNIMHTVNRRKFRIYWNYAYNICITSFFDMIDCKKKTVQIDTNLNKYKYVR